MFWLTGVEMFVVSGFQIDKALQNFANLGQGASTQSWSRSCVDNLVTSAVRRAAEGCWSVRGARRCVRGAPGTCRGIRGAREGRMWGSWKRGTVRRAGERGSWEGGVSRGLGPGNVTIGLQTSLSVKCNPTICGEKCNPEVIHYHSALKCIEPLIGVG